MRTGHRTRRLGSLFAVLLCCADALSAPGDKPAVRSDPMSVEELQRKLRSAEVDERRLAAERLPLLPGIDALPLWQKLLADADAGLRGKAAKALGELAAPEAIGGLVTCASDSETTVRQACVEALGHYGELPIEQHKRAVTMLGRVLGDGQFEVRSEVMRTLDLLIHRGALTTEDVGHLLTPVLQRCEDEQLVVRRLCAGFLGQLGPLPREHAQRVAMTLLSRTADASRDVRATALESLAKQGVGVAAGTAVRLLQEPQEDVQKAALLYLGTTGYLPATRTIIELFEHGSDGLRMGTAHALGALGRWAQKVEPREADTLQAIGEALFRGLLAEDRRLAAREALLELGDLAARDALNRLGDPTLSADGVGTLLELLRDLGPTLSKDLSLRVVDTLRDERTKNRVPGEVIIEALTGLLSEATGRVLVEFLASADLAVRRAALRALLGMPTMDRRAEQLLLLVSREQAPEVRGLAAGCLGKLGTRGSIDRLMGLVEDGTPEVRLAALRAIGQVAPEAGRAGLLDEKLLNVLLIRLRAGGGGEATSERSQRRVAAQTLGDVVRATPALLQPAMERLLEGLGSSQLTRGDLETVTALGHALRGRAASLPSGVLRKASERLLDLATGRGEGEETGALLAVEALDALGAARDGQTAGRLIRLLKHSDPLRRGHAVAALGNLLSQTGDVAIWRALLTVLSTESDVQVSAEAAWALGKLGGETGGGAEVSQELRRALLRSAEDTEQVALRVNALGALARLGQGEPQDARWLVDGEAAVRQNALLLLANLPGKTPGLLTRITGAKVNDADPHVRRAAERALRGERVQPARGHSEFVGAYVQDSIGQPRSQTWVRLSMPDGLVRMVMTDRLGGIKEELLHKGTCEIAWFRP